MAAATIINGLGGSVVAATVNQELAEWSLERQVTEIDNPHFTTEQSADDQYYIEADGGMTKGYVNFSGKHNAANMPTAIFVPGTSISVVLTAAAGLNLTYTGFVVSDNNTVNAETGSTYTNRMRITSVSVWALE